MKQSGESNLARWSSNWYARRRTLVGTTAGIWITLVGAILAALEAPEVRAAIERAAPPELVPLVAAGLGIVSTVLAAIASAHNPDGVPAGAPYSDEIGASLPVSRADRHSNLLLVSTIEARIYGLHPRREYTDGDPVRGSPREVRTARILIDPIVAALRMADAGACTLLGYRTETWKQLPQHTKLVKIRDYYVAKGGVIFKERLEDAINHASN